MDVRRSIVETAVQIQRAGMHCSKSGFLFARISWELSSPFLPLCAALREREEKRGRGTGREERHRKRERERELKKRKLEE